MITVAQVTQASDVELLCITFDLFLESVQEAIDEDDIEIKKKHINHCREVLKVLVNNLDMAVPLAQDLFDLYVYVQKLLVSKEGLVEAHRIMARIKDGFEHIPQDKKPSAVENAQNIYAGMTYSGSQLNEIIMENSNRGFMA